MFTKLRNVMVVICVALICISIPILIHANSTIGQAEQAFASLQPLKPHIITLEEALTDRTKDANGLDGNVQQTKEMITLTQTHLAELIELAELEKALSAEHQQIVDQLLVNSQSHAKETKDTVDTVLSKVLGDPIGQTFGERATMKIFSLKEAGYRGYMAKVKLHVPNAMKLVLAHDQVSSKGETTSQTAERKGATLAINGGGFTWQDGKIYPIGITVVDGEVKTYYSTEFSFIGINDLGHLVGGEITSKEQIGDLNIQQGASFVPTLLKDGKKQDIPSKWKNRREPRTLIGHFSNGDLLFIVIDGRQKGYSEGVTLEEAQEKLLEFNVRDAYNLDGGGSSTFYYNGKVLNSPSDGRERLTASTFIVIP